MTKRKRVKTEYEATFTYSDPKPIVSALRLADRTSTESQYVDPDLDGDIVIPVYGLLTASPEGTTLEVRDLTIRLRKVRRVR